MDTNHSGTTENLKNAYAQKFEAELNSLSADIDKLKAKAQSASADLKIKLNKQVEEFQLKRDAARTKFEEYKSASGDKLEALKGGLEKAWNDLKTSVDQSLRS